MNGSTPGRWIRLLVAGQVTLAGVEAARAVAMWWAWSDPQTIGAMNRIDALDVLRHLFVLVALAGVAVVLAGLVRQARATRQPLVWPAVCLYALLGLATAGDLVLFVVADSTIVLAWTRHAQAVRHLIELLGLAAWTIGTARAAASRARPVSLPVTTLLMTVAVWRLGLPVLARYSDAFTVPSGPVHAVIVEAAFGVAVILFAARLRATDDE